MIGGIAVAICVLLITVDASRWQSDVPSANWVLPGCRSFVADRESGSGDEIFRHGVCAGAIAAIIDMGHGAAFCLPGQATYAQYGHVVIQFIDANPTRMHEPFTRLAIEAFAKAWPCPNPAR